MPDLTPAQARALTYWGSIESAVNQRLSTADLWAAIRAASGTATGEPIGFGAADLSVVRGYAAGIRNAADNLAKSATDLGLTSQMIGQAPWGRSAEAQATLPMWQVRFQQTVADVTGAQTQVWRTVVYTGSIAPTVGDLTSQVGDDALAIADEYNQTHVSLDAMQILAV